MYKTVFIDYRKGGYDLQKGDTAILEKTIDEYYNAGYELVTITPCPYLSDACRCSYVLIFKSK